MKLYELVKEMLIKYPPLRDSDRLLIWNVWGKRGFLSRNPTEYPIMIIERDQFMKATSPESIRRCRQKIQEKHLELRSSKSVQLEKDKIARQKGTQVYRENVD